MTKGILMHPIRKQRLQIVLLIVIASSLAAWLVAYMLGQNPITFLPVAGIGGEAPENITIRAGGMVVEGSVERSSDSLMWFCGNRRLR